MLSWLPRCVLTLPGHLDNPTTSFSARCASLRYFTQLKDSQKQISGMQRDQEAFSDEQTHNTLHLWSAYYEVNTVLNLHFV